MVEEQPIRARSAISSAIAQARASLHHPSRPFTPADGGRHLFNLPQEASGTSAVRPGSSYAISAAQFAARPGPPRLPLRGVVRQDRPPFAQQQPYPAPIGARGAAGACLGSCSARRASFEGSADVLSLEGEPLDSAQSDLTAEQRKLWADVERALIALAAAATTPRGAGPGEGGAAVRHEASVALERAVEAACACADGEERLAQRQAVLHAVAPLIESSGHKEAAAAAAAGAGAQGGAGGGVAVAEGAVLMRLCNVVLRLCAPDPTGASASRGPSRTASANATPRGWLPPAGAAAAAGQQTGAQPGSGGAAAGGEAHGSGNGGPLLAACKLLFRLSKREANDDALRAEGSLAALLALLDDTLHATAAAFAQHAPQLPHGWHAHAPPLEPLVYGLGALKNCTAACPANCAALAAGAGAAGRAAGGGLVLLQRLLRLNSSCPLPPLPPAAALSLGPGPAQPAHGGDVASAAAAREERSQLCAQAAAVLRNLSAAGPLRRQLVALGLAQDLCDCLVLAAAATPDAAARTSGSATPSAGGGAHSRPGSGAAAAPRPPRPGRSSSGSAPASARGCAPASAAAPAAAVASAEVCLNVFRALAKLTLQEDARSALNSDGRHLRAMVCALGAHRAQLQLAVRASFVLGNMTASNAANRQAVGVDLGGCDLLLSILATQAAAATAPAAAEAGGQAGGAAPSECVDALVKGVRLLAHLAMAPDVGAALAQRSELAWLLALLESQPVETAEELLLNAASAITNISFYAQHEPSPASGGGGAGGGGGDSGGLLAEPQRLVRCLTRLLLLPNPEAVTEAARALGNCSRDRAVRDAIVCQRVHEALLLLLGHSSDAVLLAVCGVLINLAADSTHRTALDSLGALGTLAELLTHALAECSEEGGGGDGAPFALCAMAAKIAYNLALPGHAVQRLRAGPRAELLEALRRFESAEEARAQASHRGGEEDEGAQLEADRADARQVCAVLLRVFSAQPHAPDEEEDGTRRAKRAESQLEPLPLSDADGTEGPLPLADADAAEDELSRLGTHRPATAQSHNVACG